MTERRWQLITPTLCSGGIRIEGAGSSAANGDYCPDGTENGRAVWTRIGGTRLLDSIYWADAGIGPAEWWMNVSGATLYVSISGVGVPSNWIQAAGASPAPVNVFLGEQPYYTPEPLGLAKFAEEEDLSFGLIAKRRKLTTDLVFVGADYNYFLAIKRDVTRRCEEIIIRRQWKCNGRWVTYWKGTFSAGVGTWDYDNCTWTVKPEVLDRYTCIIKALENKVNILGGEQVHASASIAVDVEFGFSYSFFATAGTGPVLYTTQGSMVDASNGGVNGWGWAQAFYMGNLSQEFASNPPPVPVTGISATGEMVGYEGSALTATIIQAMLDDAGPFIGNTVLDYTIYRHMWWRERRTVSCEFGTSSPPAGSGWVLVTDNCGVDGTALYGRPPLFGYTGGNAGATGVISPSPPIDPCSTYVGVGIFGFDNLPMFICFDANGTSPIALDRARLLESCANLMLQRSGCGGVMRSDFFEWDPPGTAPGYSSGVNYVTGTTNQVDQLVILQNSDAIDPAASNPATRGDLTLKELFIFFVNEFQVFWAIDDDGNLRLEHWIFWTFPIGLDLNDYGNDDKSEPRFYTHLNVEIPRIERLKAAHASNPDFVGADIIYSGPCVTGEEASSLKEYSLGPFTTDIAFIFTDPDEINKVGFTVLATVLDSGTYVTIVDTGALSGAVATNAPLSVANAERDYWTWNRFLFNGNMNEQDVEFDGIQPNIEQKNVVVKMCCDTLNFVSTDRVVTVLGVDLGGLNPYTAFVRRLEFDEATECVTLTLRYAY